MRQLLSRFGLDRRGVALIEMAIVTPFMLLLFLGGFEVVRYIILLQKVEKATYALANITAQYPPATYEFKDGEIDEDELRLNVFPQLQRIMAPYTDTNDYVAIVTSIRRESDEILVKWQMGGGGTRFGSSSVVNGAGPSDPPDAGVRDTAASFNAELAATISTMINREHMIVAEVFYSYRPILTETLATLGFIVQPVDVHRWLFLRPRYGDLICLPPSFIYEECEPPPPPEEPECTYMIAVCDEGPTPGNPVCCRGLPDSEPMTMDPCIKNCDWQPLPGCMNGPC